MAGLAKARLGTYRKELQGHGQVLFRSLNLQPNKSFVSFVVYLFSFGTKDAPTPLIWEVLTMSTNPVIAMCPVCGGDRTSMASNGELYCVDCNHIYLVSKPHRPEELALKPADRLHNVGYIKRAA
jgi:hypothetical protein